MSQTSEPEEPAAAPFGQAACARPPHLSVPPVQGLVLQDLQGADVLGGQEVVEGAQALAQLDVQAAVPKSSAHDAVCRPLVAG